MTDGTTALRVVEQSRQTMARSLAETRVARNNGGEHYIAKVALELLIDLVGKSQTCVIHSEQEALDVETAIKLRLDDANGVEQLADALKCEVLGLNGDNHTVGCCQGINP